MLNKILISLIVISIFLIVILLNSFAKNLATSPIFINSKITEKSALDAVLFKRLELLRMRPKLIKALTEPPKTVQIKSLWVDKNEVRQGDFYKFVGWSRIHSSSAIAAKNQPADWKFFSSSKNDGLSGKLEVSANGISFFDAFSYCAATKGRLPNADEFFAIAQKHPQQLYPWGVNFNAESWPYFDARLNATVKSGSFKNANTVEGVADLGAILAEWTMGDYPRGKPFIQGGDAYSNPHDIYALNMVYRRADAKYRSVYVGFRCVYDERPKAKSPWKSALKTVHIKDKKVTINHYPNSKIRPLLHYLSQLSLAEFKSLLPHNKKSNYRILVGVNEVSVLEYRRFLSAAFSFFGGFAHEQQPKNHDLTPLNWQQQQKYPNRPVVGVDWWSAYHFANWVGGKLPSAKEFTKIQILTQSAPAPHQKSQKAAVSDEEQEQESIFKQNRQSHPADLTKTTKITHLLGNVAEWTRSIDTSTENLSIIVKGGSYLTDQTAAQDPNYHQSITPHHRSNSIGFRVIFD